MSTQPDSTPAATAEAPDKGVGCDALFGEINASKEAAHVAKQLAAVYPDARMNVEAVAQLIDANFARIRNAYQAACYVDKQVRRLAIDTDALCCDLNPNKDHED